MRGIGVFASLMPGLQTIAALPRSAIPREIGAGISVAAVAIPVGLAYAQITGVPTEIGLYASIVPTLAYALFGPSSRYLIVGPDTATCLLLAATLTSLGVTAPEQRAEVAAGLTLLMGMGCLVGALLKLGFVANLVSRPVLVGYLAGVSLTLLVSQLPSLTHVDLQSPALFRPIIELVRRSAEIHWPTVTLGLGLLVMLRLLKRFAPRIPGAAVVVILAVLAVGCPGPGRARLCDDRQGIGGPAAAEDSGLRRRPGRSGAGRGRADHRQLLERHPDRAGVRAACPGPFRPEPRADRVRRGGCRRRPVPGLRRDRRGLAHGGRARLRRTLRPGRHRRGDHRRRRGGAARALSRPAPVGGARRDPGLGGVRPVRWQGLRPPRQDRPVRAGLRR